MHIRALRESIRNKNTDLGILGESRALSYLANFGVKLACSSVDHIVRVIRKTRLSSPSGTLTTVITEHLATAIGGARSVGNGGILRS